MSSNKRLRLSDPSSVTPEASASSSSFQKRFKYDVFISFRGEDTRKTFVGHLYQALKDKGIYTYKDDEKIEQGKTIDNQLIQAIRGSRYFIIVFSQNYASSSWCLDELVEIMECQKTGEQTAYPVFLDVEPTEVRKQSGAFGEAFLENKKEDAAGKWIEALKGAAGLAGRELKNTLDGHEAKFIKKIVQQISLELRSINFSFDEKLVGMETRARDVISSSEIGIDEVRMIGIKGMGGAGKTTLARAVFDLLSADFEANSFVENVREVSNASMFGLKKLQEQVLLKVLNEHVTLDSVNDGKNIMKRTMCGKKILLVLDDVDHIEQLKALAGEPKWFKRGSRILITTRDEQVLVAHRVDVIRDIVLLSEQEAISLFSRYAFGKENPVQGYEELSRKVVRYAAGLPLTVEVMGSFLCGKDKLEWVDAIDRLQKIPLKDTLEKLELSYISLEDDYKELFLDIACIFKGRHKQKAIRIIESCGFHARIGLKVLEQRSLITISGHYEVLGMHDHIDDYKEHFLDIACILKGQDKKMGISILESYGFHDLKVLEQRSLITISGHYEVLGMHDHIEEMAKNIVRRSHPGEPKKHSHLWIDEEIEDILANDMGTEATRCLKLYTRRVNAIIVMKGLGKMKKLGYLGLYFTDRDSESDCENDDECLGSDPKFDDTSQLDESTQYFPNSLKYLECWGYPFLYLPKTFQANNLVGLEMEDSKMVQLWEEGEEKILKKLKFVSLDGSRLTTFDFGITPNLETLSLIRCFFLKELCMPASCQKLNYLQIIGSKLRTFDLGLTPNLETLILSAELHVSVACPNLKSLRLLGSRLRSLDLELIPNLERLDLKNCADFEELYLSIACPNLKNLDLSNSRLRSLDLDLIPNLERLDLKNCADFEELHLSIACPNLKNLDFSNSRLRSLDLDLIPNLERLDLKNCADFEELHLSIACPNLKNLDFSNSRLRSLDLDLIPNLERLDLRGCDKLVEINAPVGCLKKVVYLNLSGCLRFPQFEFGSGSEPSQVSRSSATLHLVGESLNSCPLHPDCNLPKLQFRFYYEENLPSSVGNIEKLISFGLCACTDFKRFSDSICMLKRLKSLKVNVGDLEKLPDDLGQLECLENLDVYSKKIEYLPDSICMLKHLKELYVTECCSLEKLPEDIGRLESLEILDLQGTTITHFPNGICMLKRLKSLAVTGWSLKKLPEDIGQLESLEKLGLWDTSIKHLPDSVCMLKYLKFLKLDHCTLLKELPEDLGRLECLEKLDINRTGISHLPQSIFGLKGLQIAALPELLWLYRFRSGIRTTSSCLHWC